MKRTAILFLFLICGFVSQAQTPADSCTLEISLLTCAPGTELYSIFGHTAIRVQDTHRGMDIIYNYGTFDDSDPLFYVRFTRGIMTYSLSVETFHDFMQEYEYEHRKVVAQVLDLTCAEKSQLYESLRTNSLEENRFYPYHFHRDNCTTRAGRIIESNTKDPVRFKNILPVPGPSYRDMIHEYLYRQYQYWDAFGIDLFLGMNLDMKPTNDEAIHFLPDYLFMGMDSAITGNKPLIARKKILLNFPETTSPAAGLTPGAAYSVLLLLVTGLCFLRTKPAVARVLLIFDIVFFSLLGGLGILMAYLWLGRVDDVCRNNINILWALPTHTAAVFFIRKKTAWIKYYFLITAMLAALLLAGFPWWPQSMNPAVLPLLGIILFRSFLLYKNRNHAEKSFVQG